MVRTSSGGCMMRLTSFLGVRRACGGGAGAAERECGAGGAGALCRRARYIFFKLPGTPTPSKVLQILPSRTCALWVGLHGLRHCIGVVVTITSCVPGLVQACGAMFRLEVKSPFNTRGLLGMQVYFSQFQRTPFGMLRLDPQVCSAP